ncbi:MAG TPA: G1 family glutamic endopeptidase [Thermoplasmata archaeon]|nr:G1 family glutamic endopeptidase [Thermoplasmata archaeon]
MALSIAILCGSIAAIAATGGAAVSISRSSGAPLNLLAFGTTSKKTTVSAGYVVPTGYAAVTDVRAEWNVPQIAAACPSKQTGSSFLIGMDGWTSSTFEEIGTATYCVGGSPSYYAWYELYPKVAAKISLTVKPADHISAEVSYGGGGFAFKLKDLTSGKSFSKSVAYSGAYRNSAEWIAYDPSSGSSTLPLTDFGWVTFTNANATIGGHTHTISGYTNYALTMWNLAGTKVKASVGALSSGGSVFRVTWKAQGP